MTNSKMNCSDSDERRLTGVGEFARKPDRLSLLRTLDSTDIQSFLQTRQSSVIPAVMQGYIVQMDSCIQIIHHLGTNVTRVCKEMMRQWGDMTQAQARSIYYDSLEYYYVDESVSARAWDMVFADQFENLKDLAIKEDKLNVAYKCMDKAHELRTTRRESLDYNWHAPVYLININVKPEDLGYESETLAAIAHRHEDDEIRQMIGSLEASDAEKKRMMQEAGIKEVEFIKDNADE